MNLCLQLSVYAYVNEYSSECVCGSVSWGMSMRVIAMLACNFD